MSTKHELNTHLNLLAAIEAKLGAFPLDDHERETLAELLSEEQGRRKQAWRHERAEQAISLLFPTWRGGSIEKPQHSMWHDKSWWWNGASIDSLDERSNGDLAAQLSSYVGGGDTDTIYGFIIRNEWLEADDMEAAIREYCEGQEAARTHASAKQAEARARAELAAAQARLTQLGVTA